MYFDIFHNYETTAKPEATQNARKSHYNQVESHDA